MMMSNEIFAEKVVNWFQGNLIVVARRPQTSVNTNIHKQCFENNTDPPHRNLNVLKHVSFPIGYTPRAGL